MNRVLLSILICCVVGCKLPEQPELAPLEKAFITKLSEKCNCEVFREINPDAKLDSPEYEEGWYFIGIELSNLSKFENSDSLRSISFEYAKILHRSILVGHGYKYDKITFGYDYPTGENSNKSQYFDFKLSELE